LADILVEVLLQLSLVHLVLDEQEIANSDQVTLAIKKFEHPGAHLTQDEDFSNILTHHHGFALQDSIPYL
jgi:hypothetical protein